MTTSSSLSGGKLTPKPPAKGSFPLDHLSECRAFAKAYRLCLQRSAGTATSCRSEARAYLKCRMERGLMASDEWHKLGLDDSVNQNPDDSTAATTDAHALHASHNQTSPSHAEDSARVEAAGFVAGARTARRRRERGVPKDNKTDSM